MDNAQRQKKFREEAKRQGRVSVAFVIPGEVSDMLADLAKESGYAKNLLVEKAIRGAHEEWKREALLRCLS